jgi:hypothetical protein
VRRDVLIAGWPLLVLVVVELVVTAAGWLPPL